jgi:ABC-type transporter Mla subunit MlaD
VSRQAIVGAFTIGALLALFAIFFVLANVGTQGRYRVGIHFKSAQGLHKGALVYLSGVNIGIVDATILRPEDFTVEVLLAINNNADIPRDARYVVNNPITGDVTLEIVPPRNERGISLAILPREVLPLDQQPQGTNPPTLTDVVEQGQGEVKRLDRMLAELERREPELLDLLGSALHNFNELTSNGNAQISHVTGRLSTMMDTLSVAIDASGRNIVDLTGKLDREVGRNTGHFEHLVTMLDRTSVSLNQTVDAVRDLATSREAKQNLLDTTRGLADTAQTIAGITADLRRVTASGQTQAQMRDAVANVDAATQKLNSLLGALGGRSSVYGVDRGATPAPGDGGSPAAGTTGAAPNPGPTAQIGVPPDVRARLGAAARNLLAIQIRVSELTPARTGTSGSPLLTNDRGPQTDFNVVGLPRGRTSLLTGANDIGSPNGATSWNFALEQSVTPQLRLGGGVLYSRLGVLARYEPGPVSLQGMFYDPRHPTFDAQAGVRVAPSTELFAGERDLLHSGRRTELGIQLQF